ncbi:MAG TPA: hypothetical protein VF281_00990 [Candidatus Saccharimonadales bacterium]
MSETSSHKSQLEAKIASAQQAHDTVLVDMLKQQLAEHENTITIQRSAH